MGVFKEAVDALKAVVLIQDELKRLSANVGRMAEHLTFKSASFTSNPEKRFCWLAPKPPHKLRLLPHGKTNLEIFENAF
jgi:hypothetical protein